MVGKLWKKGGKNVGKYYAKIMGKLPRKRWGNGWGKCLRKRWQNIMQKLQENAKQNDG